MNIFKLQILVTLLVGGCWTASTALAEPSGPFGRDNGTVTVPVEIQWGEGIFFVVPLDDTAVPEGTPVENCPDDGLESPPLPAGFPNGGGLVISMGDGEGRHFGRLTEFSTRCAVQFFPPTDPPGVNFDLRATLTAADGSELFVRAPFAKTPFAPPDLEPPSATVVGGTGRFEGASGHLTSTGGGEVVCTDDSGFCLEGTWSGGALIGEITIPRP
jgi:hypothetical protein